VPYGYQNVIEACWKQDPLDRPSFREIVNMIGGDFLALPETDMWDFKGYQEKMLEALKSPSKEGL
jgi:hypothetical protein